VLQSFVENILPKDENLFGDAASADMCRSMLAEQLATQLAKGGSLGIAKLIKAAHPPDHVAAATLPGPVAPPTQSNDATGIAPDRLGAGPAFAPWPSREGNAS
jgi:Rod binding domain-containing protein